MGRKNKKQKEANEPKSIASDSASVASNEDSLKRKNRATERIKIANTVPTQNRFEELSDMETDGPSTSHSKPRKNASNQRPPPQPANLQQKQGTKAPAFDALRVDKKMKPIVLENSSHEAVQNLLKSVDLHKSCLYQKCRGNRYNIFANNFADKQTLLEKVKGMRIPFHTYSEPQERHARYVLHGHYHIQPSELLMTLQQQNIPATHVSLISRSVENPVYLVHFEKRTITYSTLRMQHSVIANLKVFWDYEDTSRKQPTQCHRCQRFGHSQNNCGNPFRCIKCLNSHDPGQCLRKTREGVPSCVNCQTEGHASNSRNCPSYKRQEERVIKHQPTPKPRHFVSTPAPWANQSQERNLTLNPTNFPIPCFSSSQPANRQNACRVGPIATNNFGESSPTQNPRVPTNEPQGSFSQFPNEFSTIPGIQETWNHYMQMIHALKTIPPHDLQSRTQVLIKYIGITWI